MLLLLACTTPEIVESAPLDLPEGSRVGYSLAWDWSGAEWQDDVLVFDTAMGYRVGLEQAWLVVLAAELVPCPRQDARQANHTSGADASLIETVLVEDMLAGDTVELGVGVTGPGPYCDLHMLEAPDADVLDGQTIRLAGWFLAPDAEDPVSFDAEVGLSGGALPELSGVHTGLLQVDSDGQPLDAAVLITRNGAAALDKTELADLSEAEIAYAFLGGLGRETTARWTR